MNPHLKQFLEANVSQSPHSRQFTLLKLNYGKKQTEEVEPGVKSSREPTVVPVAAHVPRDDVKTNVNMGVEVQKPLYDGYILSPDAVKDMLADDMEPEPSATSAQAHYNATKHLRGKPKSKTETRATMTETRSNLQSAQMPTPPDVLLNLKFDSNDANQTPRDFVNVADLDSDSIEHILKLIENEQSGRKGQKGTKPTSTETAEVPKVDELTKKLLGPGRLEDNANYEELMAEGITAGRSSSNRQQAADELQTIDDRIRAMNQIAEQIGQDYAKFGHLADKLDELVEMRQIAEKTVSRTDKPAVREVTFKKPVETATSALKQSKEPVHHVPKSVRITLLPFFLFVIIILKNNIPVYITFKQIRTIESFLLS